MKIQHVKLSHFEHFLVVDGVRGPLTVTGPKSPATHPCGVLAWLPSEKYDHSADQRTAGKVFMGIVADVEYVEDTACEPAREAYKVYEEVTKTCTQIKLARYGDEAAPAVGEAP